MDKTDIDDLRYLMQRLRNPETGCPWDLKQTFSSIVPHTLEEVYEVVDTIEREDYPHLKEELGDLLFQVIFYSQLAEEQSLFRFEDIVSSLVEKLVLRHPHVFPGKTLESERDIDAISSEPAIEETWEAIKKSERQEKGFHSILADIPTSLPALTRAQKLQKRASNHGFDWPSIDGVMDKLDEENNELKESLTLGNQDHIEEEVGDMMFTLVNLCRHLNIDAETSLRKASRKFERRFHHVEESVQVKGQKLTEIDLEGLDNLWKEAKEKQAQP